MNQILEQASRGMSRLILYWIDFCLHVSSLLHSQSRSEIASDQRSQPITDTSVDRKNLQKEQFLASDRHSITIADFGFSDCYPIALRSPLRRQQTLVHLAVPICAQPPPPPDKDTRSRDQSFGDYNRDHNFDRAIRCALRYHRPILGCGKR